MVEKLPLVVRPGSLAQNKTKIKGYLAIEKLPRLSLVCPSSRTPIEAILDFGLNGAYGCVSLKIEIAATLVLECQRCLSQMQWKTWFENRLCIVESDAHARRLPNSTDYYVCTSGKISIADLIEDELLLVIPQNPMHNSKDECNPEFIGYLSRYRSQSKRKNVKEIE